MQSRSILDQIWFYRNTRTIQHHAELVQSGSDLVLLEHENNSTPCRAGPVWIRFGSIGTPEQFNTVQSWSILDQIWFYWNTRTIQHRTELVHSRSDLVLLEHENNSTPCSWSSLDQIWLYWNTRTIRHRTELVHSRSDLVLPEHQNYSLLYTAGQFCPIDKGRIFFFLSFLLFSLML